MFKKPGFWIYICLIFQGLTFIAHMIGFIQKPSPKNETEKELFKLMKDYKLDLGAGFHRSMLDISNAFSLSFALLILYSFITVYYTFFKSKDLGLIQQTMITNCILYAVMCTIMLKYTFLPPVICTSIVCIVSCLAYIFLKK